MGDGEVEVGASCHGAKRKRGFHRTLKRGSGTNKRPVIFERQGRVFTEIIPDCKGDVAGLIRAYYERGRDLFRGWCGYNGLVGYDYHDRVHHGEVL